MLDFPLCCSHYYGQILAAVVSSHCTMCAIIPAIAFAINEHTLVVFFRLSTCLKFQSCKYFSFNFQRECESRFKAHQIRKIKWKTDFLWNLFLTKSKLPNELMVYAYCLILDTVFSVGHSAGLGSCDSVSSTFNFYSESNFQLKNYIKTHTEHWKRRESRT